MTGLLLDHLWQSTVFTLAAGVLTLLLRKNGAAARYWLWFAASIKFLVPFSLLSALGGRLFQPLAPAMPAPLLLLDMQPAAQPFSAARPVLSAPAVASGLHLEPILLTLWALGCVAAILIVWLLRGAQLRAALRDAESLPIAAPVPVKASAASLEPGLVGIWRPVLLLPHGIAERLSPPEMQAVLAHELCHLSRRDNLLAAIHMLVEALFWFYPPVWWLGARLIAERERACDESVVAAGNDPQVYAEGILKVCKFYLHSPLACAAGVSGADLKQRMETIMENSFVLRLSGVKKIVLVGCAIAAIAVPVAAGLLSSPLAMAQGSDDTALSPAVIAQRRAEQAQPRTAIPFDPKSFDKFAGTYQLAPPVIATVFRDGDHFFTRLTGQVNVEIFPESPTKFFTQAIPVPAQFSFVTDAQGNVTEMVLHQGGMERHAKRIDEAAAKSIEAAFALRVKNQTASPGTEDAVRHQVETIESSGQPDYDKMGTALAAAARQQNPLSEQNFKKWGAFKSMRFAGVGPGGADIYDVTFENGQTEWRISPLNPDGKIDGLGIRELP